MRLPVARALSAVLFPMSTLMPKHVRVAFVAEALACAAAIRAPNFQPLTSMNTFGLFFYQTASPWQQGVCWHGQPIRMQRSLVNTHPSRMHLHGA